jgi:hypothetical protein
MIMPNMDTLEMMGKLPSVKEFNVLVAIYETKFGKDNPLVHTDTFWSDTDLAFKQKLRAKIDLSIMIADANNIGEPYHKILRASILGKGYQDVAPCLVIEYKDSRKW